MTATKERTGVYNVKESGLEYQFLQAELSTPRDGEEFLERFRYVNTTFSDAVVLSVVFSNFVTDRDSS